MFQGFRLLLAAGALLCTDIETYAQAAQVSNFAPFWVDNSGADDLVGYQRALGPVIELRDAPPVDLFAVRPFYVNVDHVDTGVENTYSLYPLFTMWERDYGYRWSLYNLIIGQRTELDDHVTSRFEVWPLFWYYNTGDEETSYVAQFPLAGTLKGRLFHKRLDWVLFPLWVRQTQRNHVDNSILWPIFRMRGGEGGASGAAVWPLYGHFERPDDYDRTFALWPLVYNNYDYSAAGTYHALGVLPFYAQETAPGLESRSFLWPLFGYTREWEPRADYSEVRYLYPFFVQGRGEEKYVNRWLPFYTHETRPDYVKNWYLWPLLKTESQEIAGVHSERQSVLFFLYKNTYQTAPGQPGWSAQKTHLWPVFSYWDSGEGTRQFQLLSPLEVLFPGNEGVQRTWSPLFAVYRYQGTPLAERHSVLWDLLLWENGQEGSLFQVGPLFEREADREGSRWSVLKGLISIDRRPDGGTQMGALWGLTDSSLF